MADDSLEAFFTELARRGVMPARAWPPDEDPALYGLERRGDQLVPLVPYDPLSTTAILDALSPTARAWLRDLRVLPAIGSTNAELMRLAQHGPVAGCVWLAEVQLQGRGRRGRTWFSPFGANLAVSIGLAVERPAAVLGGASLVVGLAVLEALEQLKVPDLALKWPNDILLGGAKLGGILIEMTQSRGDEVQLVVGVGLNVALPQRIRAALEQPVADLAIDGRYPPRNQIAGKVVSSVVQFVGHFERRGFDPFVDAFNARHFFHDRPVEILQGAARSAGRVRGVSPQGGLLLQTQTGIEEFHGGEVSLRRSP